MISLDTGNKNDLPLCLGWAVNCSILLPVLNCFVVIVLVARSGIVYELIKLNFVLYISMSVGICLFHLSTSFPSSLSTRNIFLVSTLNLPWNNIFLCYCQLMSM
uniref:Uncharacterized protein n=1 Tax=Manihot esculenta TaxID=3983 RepID=A0A2C9VYB1_MANES